MASSLGAATDLDTIIVRFPGLVALAASAYIEHIGVVNAHSSSHWGTPAMNARLRALAETLFVIHGRTLPLKRPQHRVGGGKFDVDARRDTHGDASRRGSVHATN